MIKNQDALSNDKGPSKRYNNFFFFENAGRKKQEEKRKVRQTITLDTGNISKGALYIKNDGVQEMEHKCAKKGKVQNAG